MTPTIERRAKPRVLGALTDTRIVVIQGARQVGKTTLVREVVGQIGGLLVTFGDELTRSTAQADPVGFLNQNPQGLLAVDEIQRLPELVLALKLAVDRDPHPGRFLITGSANLLRIPATQDSLAGRTETVELHGLSQGELAGHRERFIDRLFEGARLLGHTSTLGRRDYLEQAIAGTYPEALARTPGSRRNQWPDNYLTRIVERDAPDVSHSPRLGDLPLILRVLAARNAEQLNVTNVAKATGIPVSTITRHLKLLETLYLIQLTPAWSTNLPKRAVSRPKVCLLDTGLVVRLVNISVNGAAPEINGTVAGHLLEGFVAGELRRQLGWTDELIRISHYRDRASGEVDFILETSDGHVAVIEVKSSSCVQAKDVRWLTRLRDQLGDRFVGGLVLHTGPSSGPFGERITAAPIDALWTI